VAFSAKLFDSLLWPFNSVNFIVICGMPEESWWFLYCQAFHGVPFHVFPVMWSRISIYLAWYSALCCPSVCVLKVLLIASLYDLWSIVCNQYGLLLALTLKISAVLLTTVLRAHKLAGFSQCSHPRMFTLTYIIRWLVKSLICLLRSAHSCSVNV
jgi:hypothetical protein